MSSRADGINSLIGKINTGLNGNDKFVVRERDLIVLWPYLHEEKAHFISAIQEFAKLNGWSVEIENPEIKVTFRRL